MKSICLIYTGNCRTWNLCHENHKETFGVKGWPVEERNFHIYFYTHERPERCPIISEAKDYTFNQIPESFYPDPFAPHKYNERKAPENKVHQVFNQWMNNFVGFRLVPKGFDVYVRVRPDIKFADQKIDWDSFDYSGNNIYIPQGNDYGENAINDQFAFGNYSVMKAYYSIFLNCHELWENGILFHSETMQKANLIKEGINIIRLPHPEEQIIR